MAFHVKRSFNDSNLANIESLFGPAGYGPGFVNPLWEKTAHRNIQLNLFEDTSQEVLISITDFWMAAMCPKMFKAYFLTKELDRPPHKPPILEIGTRVDKIIKGYFEEIGTAKEDLVKEKYYELLQRGLNNLSTTTLSKGEIEFYLAALVDFFDAFKNFELVDSTSNKVNFKIGRFRFRGDYDLLLQNKENGKKILVDIKLRKFGNTLEELEFYEFLQVLLYYLGLKRRGIAISHIGYYFFAERTFILDSKIIQHDLEDYFLNLVNHFSAIKDFKPKKCFLCLICNLKKNCAVGRNIQANDFKHPLLFEQMK